MPGVQGDRYTEQGGGTVVRPHRRHQRARRRSLQNNFLLDGVDNNSISENVQELTTQVSRPSVDAIQEFKVVTSPYSAEYGRSPGAAISVTTKSGTNEFHGTAYDYFRNDRFDANDFFSKRARTTPPSPPTTRTSSAATSAGRSSRTRRSSSPTTRGRASPRGVTRLTRVPTADERAGIFSQRRRAIR